MNNNQAVRLTRSGDVVLIQMAHTNGNFDPDGLNILTPRLRTELRDAYYIAVGWKPKAILIAGSSRTFSAGADVFEIESAILASRRYRNREPIRNKLRDFHELMNLYNRSPAPVVVYASGNFVLGGGVELFLAGHYRLAAPSVIFQLPERAQLGLWPGAGGTVRLGKLVENGSLSEDVGDTFINDGKKVNALHAREWGIVHTIIASLESALCHVQTLSPEKLSRYRDQALTCTGRERNREISTFIQKCDTRKFYAACDAFRDRHRENERVRRRGVGISG